MPAPLVDDARVAAWMDTQGLAPGLPISVTRITTGHSNEVFRVERGELVAVLRRPPRTPLSPTAHDMGREFRVLTAFHGAAGWNAHAPVPVPDPIALCADADVIGAPFYLMRVVDVGWVLGLWAEATDAASVAGVTPFAGRGDVPTRRELLDRYAQDSRRDLSNVNYYCVLGLFKLACVMEGSYARFRAGTSDDAY